MPPSWSDALRAVPSRVQALVESAATESLRSRPGAGEWSAIEVVGHLVDKFGIWAVRARSVVETPGTGLDPYDQDASVRDHGYQDASLSGLLTALRSACEAFAASVEGWSDEELAREGSHPEYGAVSAEACIRLPLESVDDHLAQMQQALASG